MSRKPRPLRRKFDSSVYRTFATRWPGWSPGWELKSRVERCWMRLNVREQSRTGARDGDAAGPAIRCARVPGEGRRGATSKRRELRQGNQGILANAGGAMAWARSQL